MEKQANLRGRGIGIGADIVLACPFKAVSHFRRRIPRKSLDIPKGETAADKQVKKDRPTDNDHEFRAK
ncbi:hypothetical protein [Rhizobium sp. 007]|uniref:hypothetical protein n=1 Tax=Rhizobium sp. 007 TaxID=2785056 RepID=UPI001FF03DFD|nr:hypothetical protein [Rhizobium sp. 007]